MKNREIDDLKFKISQLERQVDGLVLEKRSEGTVMLELECIKADND